MIGYYQEIENVLNENLKIVRKNNKKLNFDCVMISNEYLVFYNEKTKKYICFNHSFEMDLIGYLLNCGNPLYILCTEKIYYFSDKYIKEILMKSESIL